MVEVDKASNIALIGLIVLVIFVTFGIFLGLKKEQHQPCSAFANYQIERVPARCFKYFNTK